MSNELTERLNQILPKVTSAEFLAAEGLGNEVPCHIFTYPAGEELRVRQHIQLMMGRLESHHSQLDAIHLDLLDVVTNYLTHRGLLDKTLQARNKKGDAYILKALRGPLTAEKIRDFIGKKYTPSEKDLVLMSGVGSVWPILRCHSLLNSLHTIIGQTPLVMFYPGTFDGQTLRLFGRVGPSNAQPNGRAYYRAFPLIPGTTE